MSFLRHKTSLTAFLTVLGVAPLGCSETVSGSHDDNEASGGGGASGDGDGEGGGTGGEDLGGATGDESGGARNDGGSDTGAKGGLGEEDTEPPAVTSTIPADGAAGVEADTELVIEFNEAMDTASVEAAFASESLPESPSFAWSEGDTKLTIVLSEPLTYAEGSTTSVAAREYDFELLESATDVAGNPLPTLDVHFTTYRRIANSLVGIPTLDGFAQSDGGDDHPYDSESVVGWNMDRELVTFMTFAIDPLPDNIAAFESATLYAYQNDIYYSKTPYAQFGDLLLHHTAFDAVESDALASEPLRSLGVFSTEKALAWRQADVQPALSEDYALRVSRQNRSQYWLRFGSGPSGNTDYAVTSFNMAEDDTNPPRIDVIYLLP